MVAAEMKNRDNISENVYSGFLGSLIINSLSNLQNSNWRTQYGGRRNEKSRYW